MYSKKVIVTNHNGIHARPAGELVKGASAFESNIYLVKGESRFNAKSIMFVMASGIKFEDEVTIEATGADEVAAVEALVTLFENNLGE